MILTSLNVNQSTDSTRRSIDRRTDAIGFQSKNGRLSGHLGVRALLYDPILGFCMEGRVHSRGVRKPAHP